MINKLSNIGYHHLDISEENQDFVSSCNNNKYSVISLADGVSSCVEAKKGAETACKAITDFMFNKGPYFIDSVNEDTPQRILNHVLYEIKKIADEEKKDLTEYSSTLSSVFFDKKNKKLLYFNLGDSIIIASGMGKCQVIANPNINSDGCCVTTTKNAHLEVKSGVIDTDLWDSIIICSDGAWREMYSGTHLKKEVAELLSENRFDSLKLFLQSQDCFDDYSFISMELNPIVRRKSA